VGFINADISLHVLRPPTGTWIGMLARNEASARGRGLVSAECYEPDGLVARVTQTALVMPAG
jgi:acyl-CoA thioesterase